MSHLENGKNSFKIGIWCELSEVASIS